MPTAKPSRKSSHGSTRRGLGQRAAAEFTVNSLHRLLKNEKYTGVYIFHDIRNEGGMPALIDRATFDKAQEMLKVNRRAPGAGVV